MDHEQCSQLIGQAVSKLLIDCQPETPEEASELLAGLIYSAMLTLRHTTGDDRDVLEHVLTAAEYFKNSKEGEHYKLNIIPREVH
ncbi:MAG: hypothetical protein [Podoviridae sp. ctQNx1]|nr:MAG: hypothetical protein [Podoviridae sp. ctQNx1]UOF78117.1 hypothetical protein [Caudoviricetes sp.]